MPTDYKVGDTIDVLYVPGDFQSGQTDCKVDIFDESGALVAGSPFEMVEKDDGSTTPNLLGMYGHPFTADAAGIWKAKAYRLIEGEKRFTKAIKYKVKPIDIADVVAGIDAIASALASISIEIAEIDEGGQIL